MTVSSRKRIMMLLSFWLENFRSYRTPQLLSLIAGRVKDDPQNTVEVPSLGIRLLTSAAIFGPNAGGKSNLFLGLAFLKYMATESATRLNEGDSLPADPFLLDVESANRPCQLGAEFIAEETRYSFSIRVSRNFVEGESLCSFPKGRMRLLYSRERRPDGATDWYFGPHFVFSGRSEKDLLEKTRDNALLLAQATQSGNETVRPAYEWFRNRLIANSSDRLVQGVLPDSYMRYTLSSMKDESSRLRIIDLMKKADFGIEGIDLEERTFTAEQLQAMDMPVELAGHTLIAPIFSHRERSSTHTVKFDASHESAGTIKFLTLAGPLLDTLASGRVLALDDMGASLHPFLAKAVLESFGGVSNIGGAQLLFSTHDATLMKSGLLRRDQILFAEKDSSQSTVLTALSSFRPRKGEAIMEAYLHGRYCGVPSVERFAEE
jgi:uncharacterized protein